MSAAVGGTGNHSATYRIIDVRLDKPDRQLVEQALPCPMIPGELAALPHFVLLMSQFLGHFLDANLVSNLGHHELGNVERLDFSPAERVRSAVRFGLAGVVRAETTLAIRTRALDRPDARALLDPAEELGCEIPL